MARAVVISPEEQAEALIRWRETENDAMANRIRVAHQRMLADGRRRALPMDKKSRQVFLAGLSAGLLVTEAADIADRSLSAFYQIRHKDPAFALAWDDAIEASCAPIEQRLEAIALTGSPDSMATVRAAEVTLKHRAGRRYQNNGGARIDMKQGADGSSLSVRVGTPGLD